MAMNTSTPKQTSHLKREILVRLIKAYLSDNFEENTRLIFVVYIVVVVAIVYL